MFSTFIKLLVANFNFYIFLLLTTNSESFHEVYVSENYLKFLSLWTKVCNVESQISIWVTKTNVEQKLKRVQLGLWCVVTMPTGSEHNFKNIRMGSNFMPPKKHNPVEPEMNPILHPNTHA